MTSTPDRRDIVALIDNALIDNALIDNALIDNALIDNALIDNALIDNALSAGARQAVACAELGLSERTLQRWTGPEGTVHDDCRPLAEHPEPTSNLSEEERDRIVATCNAPEFASLPPNRIVPRLAGQGIWPRHLNSVGVQLLQGIARARPEPPPRACAMGHQIETTHQL